MDHGHYRKQALKLRTQAIYEPRTELRASYRSMANIYDALAEISEAEWKMQHFMKSHGRRDWGAEDTTPNNAKPKKT